MSSETRSGVALPPVVELERERAALVRAEQDLVEGGERLQRQRELVLELRLKGADTRQAQRLEQSLDDTLAEWVNHRDAIEQRIAYLQRVVTSTEGEAGGP